MEDIIDKFFGLDFDMIIKIFGALIVSFIVLKLVKSAFKILISIAVFVCVFIALSYFLDIF